MKINTNLICGGILSGILVTAIFGGDSILAVETGGKDRAFFESKVRPLLVKHCYDCHSRKAEKIKGGLLLDSREGWMAGGDSGDVITPGHAEKSLLMETVRYIDPDMEMPPKYRLKDSEIKILEQWITMGAPDPRSGKSTAVTKSSTLDMEKGRRHWSFLAVKNPQPPSVKDSTWVKDDLDRFILSGIEKAGMKPAPDAERFILIRRVTLDLTGLPPTVEEVNSFVQDKAGNDEALAKVVDRLLQTDQFGERWGRHWLDVARYADSVGRTRNVPFPYAWRFRNYVVDAFNHDKPYNTFLAEQIAGDLLPARNAAQRNEMVVATGFLALGSMDLNERDREQFKLDQIDDQIDTLGRAVLALTTGCARCHDHKFDPISQHDYYALAGIFGSTETLSGQKNKGGGKGGYTNTDLLASIGSQKPSAVTTSKSKPVVNSAAVASVRKQIKGLETQLKNKKLPSKKRKQSLQQLKRAKIQLVQLKRGSTASAKKKKKNIGKNTKFDPNAMFAMSAREGTTEDLALRVRGEPDMKGEVISRGFPEVFCPEGIPELPGNQSGRLELARWLTDPSHPLTARVMVNRVWSHLFGRGIVPTIDNFGVAGEVPTHPELLDHLATRFVSDGWSVKKLIRSIMLSRAYRMSSDFIEVNSKIDEDNKLFWRMNLRRMEAEVIRDSLLAAGGTLKIKRPTGSPFAGLPANQMGKNGIKAAGGQNFSRPVRSLYLPVFRSHLPGMFTVFDFAEPSMVNGQRDVTTVAPQALFLLNNDFVVETSKLAADRVLDMNLSSDSARIRYAYAYTLCRKPSEEELTRAGDFLENKGNWPAFMQALYSTAEFRYIR